MFSNAANCRGPFDLPLLAARAEVRRSLGHNHAADRRFAVHTRLAGSLVHAMAELEEPAAPFGCHIGGNRGTPRLDRLREHFADRIVELARALAANPRGQRLRMNPRAE